MKIPRDLNSAKLLSSLNKIGYLVTRQTGSHIRLTYKSPDGEHHVTIPDHNPIKVGTLNNILKDISRYLGISKQELVEKLF